MEIVRKLRSLPRNRYSVFKTLPRTDGPCDWTSFKHSDGNRFNIGKASVKTASLLNPIDSRLLLNLESDILEKTNQHSIVPIVSIRNQLLDVFEHSPVLIPHTTKKIKNHRNLLKTSIKLWICGLKIRSDVLSIRSKRYFSLDSVN